MEKGPIFDAADKNPEIPKTFKDLVSDHLDLSIDS